MDASSSQKKGEEAAFWDKVARERIYAAFDRAEYESVIDKTLGVDLTGQTIVDVGCASGLSAALFAARGARVIGIDISPQLIAQAARNFPEYADQITFKVGDAEHLDLGDASVDGCFFGGVLHHFPDRDNVYTETMRVLKPGGKLVAIEPNRLNGFELLEWAIADLRGKLSPNEYPINPREMKRDLAQYGFADIRYFGMRFDIPFLAQLPVTRRWFSRSKGFGFKRPVLRFVDAFRAPESRGTFFAIEGRKP
jgi:ubiquinone/menaquinone biosynthesis C-methylase UbiE